MDQEDKNILIRIDDDDDETTQQSDLAQGHQLKIDPAAAAAEETDEEMIPITDNDNVHKLTDHQQNSLRKGNARTAAAATEDTNANPQSQSKRSSSPPSPSPPRSHQVPTRRKSQDSPSKKGQGSSTATGAAAAAHGEGGEPNGNNNEEIEESIEEIWRQLSTLPPVQPIQLSYCQKIAISSGHILNDLCASLWFSYLLLYFQKVVKFDYTSSSYDSRYAAGLMFLGQIVDGVSTPLIGYEADREVNCWLCRHVRYGRCKSWHLVGSICVALSFPFIFSPCLGCTSDTTDWAKLIYYAPFITIFQIGWASSQISHLALIPKMHPDELVRTELLALRYGFTVGSNVIVFLMTWFTFGNNNNCQITPEDSTNFMRIAFIAVGIGTVFTIMFHLRIREEDDLKVKQTVATLNSRTKLMRRLSTLSRDETLAHNSIGSSSRLLDPVIFGPAGGRRIRTRSRTRSGGSTGTGTGGGGGRSLTDVICGTGGGRHHESTDSDSDEERLHVGGGGGGPGREDRESSLPLLLEEDDQEEQQVPEVRNRGGGSPHQSLGGGGSAAAAAATRRRSLSSSVELDEELLDAIIAAENAEGAAGDNNTDDTLRNSKYSTKNLNLGKEKMTMRDWLTLPQFYIVALIYMATRQSVNLSQVYMPLYLQDSLLLPCRTVATIPLTMYISGFIVSLFIKVLNKHLGRQLAYLVGACLVGAGSLVILCLNWDGPEHVIYHEYIIYGVAVLLGGGASAILVTSLSITADMIGNNVENGAFVYGAMSFCDKVSCGLTILLISTLVPCGDDDSRVNLPDSDPCKQAFNSNVQFYQHVLGYSAGGCALIGVIGIILLTFQIRSQQNRREAIQKARGGGQPAGAAGAGGGAASFGEKGRRR